MAVTWNRAVEHNLNRLKNVSIPRVCSPSRGTRWGLTEPFEVNSDRLLELPISDGTWVEECESMTPLDEEATDGVLCW